MLIVQITISISNGKLFFLGGTVDNYGITSGPSIIMTATFTEVYDNYGPDPTSIQRKRVSVSEQETNVVVAEQPANSSVKRVMPLV